MFFRIKKSGGRAYVQVVENKRVDGAVRQSVIANVGRADDLIACGALASLLTSGAKARKEDRGQGRLIDQFDLSDLDRMKFKAPASFGAFCLVAASHMSVSGLGRVKTLWHRH
jgi:hypothetical protein